SVSFRQRVSTLLLPGPNSPPLPADRMEPLSLSFFPDGERCVVLTDDQVNTYHYAYLLDTSDPTAIGYLTEVTYGNAPEVAPDFPSGERIDVSPRSDRGVFHQNGAGLFSFGVNAGGFTGPTQFFNPGPQENGMVDQDYSIDGAVLYSVSTWGDTLQIWDYAAPDSMVRIAGNAQIGVVDQKLPVPLKVGVFSGGAPSPGVPVTFDVILGGGVLAGTSTATQVVSTNANGYAEVEWILGSSVGSQTVTASASGVMGSPITFTADAYLDPNLIPLQLVAVNPANNDVGVAVTTTILARFSRAVDSLSVDTTSVYFHKVGETNVVPAEFAFTDGYRKVSLSPFGPLDFGASYEITVTDSVKDTSGGLLQNPGTTVFATENAPALSLSSVSPPSASVAAPVVLAGVSFNPNAAANRVYFNGVEAVPFDGGFDFLKVAVPVGATTGDLYVNNGSANSGTLPFTVLVPSNTTSDEVVATAGTGTATKAVTINPDGSMAYAVSPDAGVVIPINVESQQSLPAIQVGTTPVSIDMHPDGRFVYVANFNSNTVSIIDADSNSVNYHKVVGTLSTGNYPLDVVASPLGDRVYVVTADPDTTQNVDIIDANENSSNHHTVVATVGAGKGVKSITMNPDGSYLYVGNEEGYIVLDASDYSYSVVASAKTGKATRSITINPDGSLLVILTTEGEVLIVDIVPGSVNENTVIATVGGNTITKSVTINPDGTLLYLVQEENDEIVVVELNIIGGVSVIDPDASVPAFSVETTVIDTVFAGEDPENIVFDPQGTGVALVTNSGPQTVTFLNAAFVDIALEANTIIVPGYSQVPTIDLGAMGMKNVSDRDFTYSYEVSTEGPCTLQGGSAASPDGGDPENRIKAGLQPYLVGAPATSITGVTPTLAPGDSFETNRFVLDVPEIREKVRQAVMFRVSTVEDPNLEATETILIILTPPVPVFVNRFDAVPAENGIELTWAVTADEDIRGFKIYRRDEGGNAGNLRDVSGLIARDESIYVDRDTQAGREYEYVLGVVLTNGEEALSRPVSATTKALKLALFQNYPNPFNPKTTIAFTLPVKQHVTLTIYNVAGQRVATLVDEVMTEGRKTIAWEGINASGNPVGSGVYFYRLQTGEKTLTKKMVLLK
ncbi:MAG: Ig-like domain-containing protein, partial [Candidatus Latescibacterota bacterium]